MRVLDFSRSIVGICAAAAMLAGCGGSQPPIGTPGAMPQSQAIATHGEHGRSWMLPSTAGEELTDAISAHRSAYRQLFVFGTPSGKCPDGANPYGNLVAVNGLFYGTTFGGGANGGGTIFTITKSGSESVLYSFPAHNKYGGFGGGPKAGLVAINRTLYGTTPVNGDYYDGGMVFAIRTSGKHERVLHSFGPKGDGDSPQANVIDAGRTLYGTTFQGGAYGKGTVFGVNPKTGAEQLLYSFGKPEDGRQPQADLLAVDGTLYGTTTYGGASDDGTVFAIDIKSGAERVVHNFSGEPDGLDPQAGLINVNGTLYGTTAAGGTKNFGTIFSLTPSGSEHVVYSFTNSPDGENPRADLINVNGTLYGTTARGGAFESSSGGTLFSFDVAAGRERVLHSFGSGTDGAYPIAALLAYHGWLYGTTVGGGPYYSTCVTSGEETVGTVFAWRLSAR